MDKQLTLDEANALVRELAGHNATVGMRRAVNVHEQAALRRAYKLRDEAKLREETARLQRGETTISKLIAENMGKTPTKREQRQRSVAHGKALFDLYCDRRNLEAIERKQHYTVTDAIVELLHYARSKKFDTAMILRSAEDHHSAEVSGRD